MSSDRRRYQLKARAARQEQTRQRIVATTSALHEEQGPARTTIAQIARRAGVQRLTVYNNYPEASDLFGACQAHFLALHPPPDVAPSGPPERMLERLETALRDLYTWYRANQAMQRNVQRDRHLLPQLDALLKQNADPRFAAAAMGYAKELGSDRKARGAIRTMVRVAMEFRTWELMSADGHEDREIARIFRKAVAGITGSANL